MYCTKQTRNIWILKFIPFNALRDFLWLTELAGAAAGAAAAGAATAGPTPGPGSGNGPKCGKTGTPGKPGPNLNGNGGNAEMNGGRLGVNNGAKAGGINGTNCEYDWLINTALIKHTNKNFIFKYIVVFVVLFFNWKLSNFFSIFRLESK